MREGAFSDLGALLHPLMKTVLKHPAVRAQDYFDDDWGAAPRVLSEDEGHFREADRVFGFVGEDEELKEAHRQTIVESFHHVLIDEMLQIFSRPNEAGEDRRRKNRERKAKEPPKVRRLDDETRRRVDAMIAHHAPNVRKLFDDYFGLLYKSARKQFLHQRNCGDPFASTKDPVKARRVRNMLFRRMLDPVRYFDSRWGAIDDEGAERIVTAAAAKPELERFRDDLVVAVLDADKASDPDSSMVIRLLLHLGSHDRSIVEMSWFEDQQGDPWGSKGAGEAQARVRLDMAIRTTREVSLRVARELGYAEAGDGDKFKFGAPIAPDDDAAPASRAPTSQDLLLQDHIERGAAVRAAPPPTETGGDDADVDAPSMWASDDTAPAVVEKEPPAPPPPDPKAVSRAAADAHHKALSVPKRLDGSSPQTPGAAFAPTRLGAPAPATMPPRPPSLPQTPPERKQKKRLAPKPVAREPPAAVPRPLKVASAPPPDVEARAAAVPAVTTYAWDQGGNFVKVYVDLDGVQDCAVVSAALSAASCAVRVADANDEKDVRELKFAALFRTIDPSRSKVVMKSGGRFVVKLRKADPSIEWGRLLEDALEDDAVEIEDLDEPPPDPVKASMDEENARLAAARTAANEALGAATAAAGAELATLLRAKAPLAAIARCLDDAVLAAGGDASKIAAFRGANPRGGFQVWWCRWGGPHQT